jgi:hypothetical protein
MIDALKTLDALLQSSAAVPQLFPPNSRYYGLDTTSVMLGDGRIVKCLTRRFVPQPDRFALIKEHPVAQNDRLDNLAATYFGDAEQYWRLCDANNAMRPDELTETIGRRLRVTLPEGIPSTTGGR